MSCLVAPLTKCVKKERDAPRAHLNGYLWHLLGIYKGCVWKAEMYKKYGNAIKHIICQPLMERCVIQDCSVHHVKIT